MKKYSFPIGGFWFHLTLVSGNLYKDQTGGEWFKKENVLLSSGGCYRHTIGPEDCMDNKELFNHYRQINQFSHAEAGSYYHDRLAFTKGF